MEKIRKLNRLPIGIGLFILGFGLFIDILWFMHEPRIIPLYVINCIPGILFFITLAASFLHPKRKITICICGFSLFFLSIIYAGLANFGALVWDSATTPIREISRYKEIITNMKQGWNGDPLSHFPEDIPQGSSHVQMYYLPPFLQGGMVFQLQHQLPWADNVKLKNLHEQYEESALQIQNAKHEIISSKQYLNPIPILEEVELWPDDLVIYILHAKPYETNPDNWNHGYSTGVALSTQSQLIIYWLEEW